MKVFPEWMYEIEVSQKCKGTMKMRNGSHARVEVGDGAIFAALCRPVTYADRSMK